MAERAPHKAHSLAHQSGSNLYERHPSEWVRFLFVPVKCTEHRKSQVSSRERWVYGTTNMGRVPSRKACRFLLAGGSADDCFTVITLPTKEISARMETGFRVFRGWSNDPLTIAHGFSVRGTPSWLVKASNVRDGSRNVEGATSSPSHFWTGEWGGSTALCVGHPNPGF